MSLQQNRYEINFASKKIDDVEIYFQNNWWHVECTVHIKTPKLNQWTFESIFFFFKIQRKRDLSFLLLITTEKLLQLSENKFKSIFQIDTSLLWFSYVLIIVWNLFPTLKVYWTKTAMTHWATKSRTQVVTETFSSRPLYL